MICSLVIASNSLFVNCKDDDSKDKDNVIEQNDTDLVGEWETDCNTNPDSLLFKDSSTERVYNFNLVRDFDKTEKIFATDNCQEPLISYQLTGSYAALTNLEDNEDLKKINLTIAEATVTVHSEDAVKLLNKGKVCGIEDWKVDEDFGITGRECVGNYEINDGDVFYDVYDINDGTLFFSNKINFLLAPELGLDERPDNVDEDTPFHTE